MSRLVLLDTGIIGLITHPNWTDEGKQCYQWAVRLLQAGDTIIVPEICDFEIRRELLRMRRQRAIRRLDRWNEVVRYLPINTPAMRMAAELWARARMGGYPTAQSESLDADVIFAAHALQAKIDFELDVIVATTNVEHLARFVPACRWQDIQPEE